MLTFVEIKGPGAGEFLQRVTAGAVKGLEPGQGRAGLFLNGQSRVLAQFDLLRAGDRYLLAAPDECARGLAEGLEQLHFAEELEICLTGQRAGIVPDSATAPRSEPFDFLPELAWPSPVPGYRCVAGVAGGVPAGFEFARIAALVPWPGREWAAGETPALEAGMLPWIDRYKGCYPGQEVVELSLNVGHPARVLVAVEGEKAQSWDGAAVTSAAQENGKWRALVRVGWGKRESFPAGVSRINNHW